MTGDDLLSVLNQTDLQRKDNKLYQVLKGLIDRPIATPPIPPNVEVYNIDTRSAVKSVYLSTAIKTGIFYIISDQFGNAGTNPITLVGTVNGIVNPTISSDYGTLEVYSTVDGYQFWGGTAAGTFGPGNPNKSVQYNDNGIFGGSIMFYDKTLQAFGVNAAALAGILFYLELINSGSVDERLIATTLGLISTGPGTAISGYIYTDTGCNVNSQAPAVTGVEGIVEHFVDDLAFANGVEATMRVDGGDSASELRGILISAILLSGTINDLIGAKFNSNLYSGTITRYIGAWFPTPHDGTPGAIPTESYGIRIEDQTIPGISDATKNWALFIAGGTVNFGIKATGIPNINGSDGVSGSFTTVDGKTVTVTRGIITTIV